MRVLCFVLRISTGRDAVVIYTDNNGVRDTLISCISRNVVARKIFIATVALECTKQITPWYAGPTDSNMSNGLSRFRCEKLLVLGAAQCSLDGAACWKALTALVENGENLVSAPCVQNV